MHSYTNTLYILFASTYESVYVSIYIYVFVPGLFVCLSSWQRNENLSTLSEVSRQPKGAEWLWHPKVVVLYRLVLQSSGSNSTSREAAIGALQNITAGEARVRVPHHRTRTCHVLPCSHTAVQQFGVNDSFLCTAATL